MSKSKTIKYSIFIFILLLLSIPLFSHAGLVSCGVTDTTTLAAHPEYAHTCGFNDILVLINTVVNFILFELSLPLAAVLFAYAGFELVISGGDTEKKTKAKSIFTSVVIGLVLAAGSWLIVNTVLSIVGYDGCWIGFGSDCQVAKTTPPVVTPPVTPPKTTTCVSPQTLDPKTNTCVDPAPDSDVLVEGGTEDEEGCPLNVPTPSDNSSSNNPTLNFLYHLTTPKVFAQENLSREIKVQEAKQMQKSFQEARCWLTNWYENRKISNTQIQTEFNTSKEQMIYNIENTRYRIVDASNDPVIQALGYSDIGNTKGPYNNFDQIAEKYFFNDTADRVIVMRYNVKYFDNFDTQTFIHELTHEAESNGILIPKSQTEFIRKQIFPVKNLENYFNYFLNIPNLSSDLIKSTIIQPLNKNICYIVYSDGLTNSDSCFFIMDKSGAGEIPSSSLTVTVTNRYEIYIVPEGNSTEVDARLMELRFKMNLKPVDENITHDEARLTYDQDRTGLIYPIEESMNGIIPDCDESGNNFKCCLPKMTLGGGLDCTKSFTSRENYDASKEDLYIWKLKDLLNNTI